MALRLLITGKRFTPCRRNIRTVIRSATTDMAIQVTPPGMPRWGSTGITGADGAGGDIDAHPLWRTRSAVGSSRPRKISIKPINDVLARPAIPSNIDACLSKSFPSLARLIRACVGRWGDCLLPVTGARSARSICSPPGSHWEPALTECSTFRSIRVQRINGALGI
jgi:hypothetical protein